MIDNYNAKKRFGQNFLVDKNIINKIINAINPKVDDNIVEIGAGFGAITLPLLTRLNKLEIIEIDKNIIQYWQQQRLANLTIHQGDVLKFDFNKLHNSLRIVGNLPYNISSPILIKMIDYRHLITDMCFMLQKEVVDRIVANNGNKIYGRLSVILQYYFDVKYLFSVPNTAFSPQPKITSAIILLKPKQREDYIEHNIFANIVRLSFAMRRKTLKNCLKSHINQEQTDIDLSLRAEALSVDDFIKLTYDYINKTS